MTCTRHGVFETNSSSTHSISISRTNVLSDIPYIENGVAYISYGEFGWQEECFKDFETKASYCITFITGVVQEHRPRRSNDFLKMLERVILKHTEATSIKFLKNGDGYYQEGYIDHQSHGECEEVFDSDKTLANFLFNPKSFLVTDNDNH